MKQKEILPPTESVKVSVAIVGLLRHIKEHTGVPMGTFILQAVVEKYNRLPKSVKDKMYADVSLDLSQFTTKK